MYEFMSDELMTRWEFSAAVAAGVRLIAGMHALVYAKRVRTSKCLSANLTNIGFLACVPPLVVGESR